MIRFSLASALLLVLASAPRAQEVPGWDQPPYAGTLSLRSGFSDDPRTIDVSPGGTTANPVEGAGCAGYIGARPDVVLEYEAGTTFDLTISAASETDISLLVRGPDGRYYCDDDSGEGLNPSLTIPDPISGTYRVWAGVYASSGEYTDGVVGFSEIGQEVTLDAANAASRTIQATPTDRTTIRATPTATAQTVSASGASGVVPGWDGDPYFGTTVLSAGFSDDPRVVEVRAGGAQANPLTGSGCTGYIGLRPDAVVRYTAGSLSLTFSAAADQDLSLVVRTPSGRYHCDDDSGEGLNPRIDFDAPESGDYRIWVGTYAESDDLADSRLGISELGYEVE